MSPLRCHDEERCPSILLEASSACYCYSLARMISQTVYGLFAIQGHFQTPPWYFYSVKTDTHESYFTRLASLWKHTVGNKPNKPEMAYIRKENRTHREWVIKLKIWDLTEITWKSTMYLTTRKSGLCQQAFCFRKWQKGVIKFAKCYWKGKQPLVPHR